MRFSARIAGFCTQLILAVMIVAAQTDDDSIRVETQLIDVPVFVADKAGRPVVGLKRTDFLLFEDGKPQQIAEFSTTAAPFEVALLLDTSGSTRAEIALIRRSASEFIASLRPGDRVSIVAFRTERTATEAYAVTEILSPLTDDRSILTAAIEKVQTSNSTPYYDGLSEIAQKVFGKPATGEFRGRRAMVALTDGVDSASASEFDDVRGELERAGIMSFVIEIDTREFFEENLTGSCELATRLSPSQIRRFYRTYYPKARVEKTYDFCKLGDFERLEMSKGLYELAAKQIRELAKRSGGTVFPATDLSEARTAFRAVAAEIGTRYSIGYYSTNEKRDGSFRSIRVELKNAPAGTTVRAREGYLSK